jgi:hypothetical protein
MGPTAALAREGRFGELRRSLRRRREGGHYALGETLGVLVSGFSRTVIRGAAEGLKEDMYER